MNLFDVMMGAQGGQGVNTLANQFGISPQQTVSALQAMIPAFSLGMLNTAQDPMGFGALLGQMTNGAHLAAYANPAGSAAAAPGAALLGQIFGAPQIAQQVVQQAAQNSGVNAQVVQQMMPLVASMLVGGMAQAMAAQGLGAMVGQLANAFTTGAGLQAPPPAAAPLANPMSLWMDWVNAFVGAKKPAAPTYDVKAGLGALENLMQAGVQITTAQQQALEQLLQSISNATAPPKG